MPETSITLPSGVVLSFEVDAPGHDARLMILWKIPAGYEGEKPPGDPPAVLAYALQALAATLLAHAGVPQPAEELAEGWRLLREARFDEERCTDVARGERCSLRFHAQGAHVYGNPAYLGGDRWLGPAPTSPDAVLPVPDGKE